MRQKTAGRQRGERGYAMLATITTIGMLATAAVTTTLGGTALENRQAQKTAAALAAAKQALLSRAASDANHPGSLPCPDAVTNIAGNNVPNDGIADLLAGAACPSHIGRLPWRTLGLPDLRDADGERLWYMVAPAWQDSPARIINAGTTGQINGYECADGEAAAPWPCANPRALAGAPWVAVVFAPGRLLAAQLRDAAHAGDVAQFLESYNAADPMRLRIATGAGAANNDGDRLAGITADDILALVQRRIASELQALLTQYLALTTAQGQPALPWPAAACATSTTCTATPLTAPLPATAAGFLPSDDAQLNQLMIAQNMTWFDYNHWRTSFTYTIDANCAAAGITAQCGEALVATAAPFAPGTTLVGGIANTLAPGTRAVIWFAGGSSKTQIAIALQ